eukprot:TRINITY_DN5471_c0_g1_i1.p1 TRINITY_DN5471_c0_g1~~TRINITY_DN5471_c0_g1_i1.p1  ORF type:complete len:264 (-),score=42.05 TRINITY_DN5471_c0_g1_i1:81-785(-)
MATTAQQQKVDEDDLFLPSFTSSEAAQPKGSAAVRTQTPVPLKPRTPPPTTIVETKEGAPSKAPEQSNKVVVAKVDNDKGQGRVRMWPVLMVICIAALTQCALIYLDPFSKVPATVMRPKTIHGQSATPSSEVYWTDRSTWTQIFSQENRLLLEKMFQWIVERMESRTSSRRRRTKMEEKRRKQKRQRKKSQKGQAIIKQKGKGSQRSEGGRNDDSNLLSIEDSPQLAIKDIET